MVLPYLTTTIILNADFTFLFLNFPYLGYFAKACFAGLVPDHLPYLILPPIGKSEKRPILKQKQR